MEEEQNLNETEFCSHCKRDIPSSNFVMHTTHCHRNITLCQLCDEPVPKSQLEEHVEEYHTKVKCVCGESVEKIDMDVHKEENCKSRKIVCEYCELELAFGEMESHKQYCGSRTELCDKCNKYIQQKDLEEHMKIDCIANKPVARNNAARSSTNSLTRDRPEQMVQNFEFGEADGFGLGVEVFQRLLTRGHGTLPVEDIFDGRVIFDNPYMFPRDNIVARGTPSNVASQQDWRRARNGQHVDNDDTYTPSDSSRQEQLEKDEELAALLTSEDNDEPISGENYGVFRNAQPLPEINSSNLSNFYDEEDNPGLDETVLPCEFCGEPIRAQDLIQHQSGCQLTSIASACPEGYPNLRSQPRSLPQIEPEPFDDYTSRHDEDIDDHNDTLLPCEFCQELFPSVSLIVHQTVCDPNGTRPSSAVQSLPLSFYGQSASQPDHMLNNYRLPDNSRPARPSRPVVTESHNEWPMEFPNSTVNQATEFTSVPRPRIDRGNAAISDSRSGTRTTQRNNSRGGCTASSNVQLTIRNRSSTKGSRKSNNTTSHRQGSGVSRPTRATDQSDDSYEVVAPRSSAGVIAMKNGSKRDNHFQPRDSSTLSSGRYDNGTSSENGESTLEMRPLQESNKTSSSENTRFRRQKDATPSSGRAPVGKTRISGPASTASSRLPPPQHNAEVRKQKERLTPSVNGTAVGVDSRRGDFRGTKKAVVSEPGARVNSSEANSKRKSRPSGKKIV